MRYVLDLYFSSTPMVVFVNVLFISSALFLFLVPLSKTSAKNVKIKIISAVCAAGLIVFQITAHYHFGFIKKAKTILESDGFITILDVKEYEDSADYHRIYVVDKNTGKLIKRFSTGSFYELLLQKENIIFMSKRSVYGLQDVLTGKTVKIYNPVKLSRKYPQIPHGVEGVSYSTNKADFLELKGKDGNLYYMGIFSGQLHRSSELPELISEPAGNLFIQNDNIVLKGESGSSDQSVFHLENKPDTHKIRQLRFSENSKNPVQPYEFIEPVILQLYPELQRFVILSYESTDRAEYILSCFDFGLRKVWTITQKEENLKQRNSSRARLDASAKSGDDLIYNCGAFVYSVRVTDGTINWKVKL